jgi:hypothetical protein
VCVCVCVCVWNVCGMCSQCGCDVRSSVITARVCVCVCVMNVETFSILLISLKGVSRTFHPPDTDYCYCFVKPEAVAFDRHRVPLLHCFLACVCVAVSALDRTIVRTVLSNMDTYGMRRFYQLGFTEGGEMGEVEGEGGRGARS